MKKILTAITILVAISVFLSAFSACDIDVLFENQLTDSETEIADGVGTKNDQTQAEGSSEVKGDPTSEIETTETETTASETTASETTETETTETEATESETTETETTESETTELDTEETESDKCEHQKIVVPGKPATCTESGRLDGIKCALCGDVLEMQIEIPALGHAWYEYSYTDPTCENDGVANYRCSRYGCNERLSEPVPALGHDIEIVHGQAATCTEDGLTDGQNCLRCSKTLVSCEVIPATGHNVENFAYVSNPTGNEAMIAGQCLTCRQEISRKASFLASIAAIYGNGGEESIYVFQGDSEHTIMSFDGTTPIVFDKDQEYYPADGLKPVPYNSTDKFAGMIGISGCVGYLNSDVNDTPVFRFVGNDGTVILDWTNVPQVFPDISLTFEVEDESIPDIIGYNLIIDAWEYIDLIGGENVNIEFAFATDNGVDGDVYIPFVTLGNVEVATQMDAFEIVTSRKINHLRYNRVNQYRAQSENNILTLTQTEDTYVDPYIVFQNLSIDTEKYNFLKITMKLSAGNGDAQIYIITEESVGFNSSQSMRFQAKADNEYHTYHIPLCMIEGYTGYMTGFRFDIDVGIGETIEISSISAEEIKIPDNIVNTGCCQEFSYVSRGDGTCYLSGIGDCTHEEIVIPKFSPIGERVTGISPRALLNCSDITKITIPASVTYIGEEAFAGCTNLAEFVVADGNYKFKSIDGNLYSKDGKTLIAYAIGKTDTSFIIPDGVTSVGYCALFSAHNLVSVTIPSGVANIERAALSNCSSLQNIIVDKNNEYYKSIDGVLFSKDETVLLQYPAGKSASTFVFPKTIIKIGAEAFAGCSALTDITIPEGVTEIDYGTFALCENLVNVTLHDGITSIQDSAFYGCTSLKTIVLPNSITSIGGYSTFGAVETIYFVGTEEEWQDIDGVSILSSAINIVYNYSF